MRYNPYRHRPQQNPMSTGGMIGLTVVITAVVVAPVTLAVTAASVLAYARKKAGELPPATGYDPAMNGGAGAPLPNPCGR